MKEALLYTPLEGKKVDCFLCAHKCRIQDGKFGFCGVRQNIKGVLYSRNYGKIVASNIDPVEKKPLYHFLPGSTAFSIACAGCNFRCGFCQNWQVSQLDFVDREPGEDSPPDKIVKLAKESGCRSIAYTYTEPTIYFEFALEACRLAKEEGLRNIFVTNGYMTPQAISMLRPYLDAANVDLKFFKDSSYKRICAGRLAPVLESIRLLKEAGVWIEITTLVIPGENDSPEELSGIADFIASVDRDIPWHISRFHPDYKFDRYDSTPESTLKLAYDLGKRAGLHHVYAGNVYGWGQDTFCASCKKLLIKREGFGITQLHVSQGKCAFCLAKLSGIFDIDSFRA